MRVRYRPWCVTLSTRHYVNLFFNINPAGYYYDSEGRLVFEKLPARFALYECSPSCTCSSSNVCRNAITQMGVTRRCSIRWTNNRGFGLFAEEDIAKGAFLCCYVGEIISISERRRRYLQQKEEQQSNYTLVLREVMEIDGNRETLTTAIDARTRGNASHFLSKDGLKAPFDPFQTCLRSPQYRSRMSSISNACRLANEDCRNFDTSTCVFCRQRHKSW